MVERDKYSIEEIRSACKEVFHDTGEWFFAGHDEDWEEAYDEIQEVLEGKPLL